MKFSEPPTENPPTVTLVPNPNSKIDTSGGLPQMYIIIGVVVLAIIILLIALVAVFVVRKRRSGGKYMNITYLTLYLQTFNKLEPLIVSYFLTFIR